MAFQLALDWRLRREAGAQAICQSRISLTHPSPLCTQAARPPKELRGTDSMEVRPAGAWRTPQLHALRQASAGRTGPGFCLAGLTHQAPASGVSTPAKAKQAWAAPRCSAVGYCPGGQGSGDNPRSGSAGDLSQRFRAGTTAARSPFPGFSFSRCSGCQLLHHHKL